MPEENLPVEEKNERVALLSDLATKGNRQSLRDLLRIEPGYVDSLADRYASIQKVTESFLLTDLVGDNLIAQEVLKRQVNKMRLDQNGPNPTPLERLVVDRMICAWLISCHADAKSMNSKTLIQAKHWQEMREHTTRNFLRAAKTLAQIRKLMRPAVQLNVADNQVNIIAVEGHRSGDTDSPEQT